MIIVEFGAGPNAGQRVALQRTTARIGGPGCHIVIVDPDVSNPHCEIQLRDGQYYLVDLESVVGTRVGSRDAEPIAPGVPIPIVPGTTFWLGATSLELSELRADRSAKVEPTDRPHAPGVSAAAADATMPIRKVASAREPTEVTRVLPGQQVVSPRKATEIAAVLPAQHGPPLDLLTEAEPAHRDALVIEPLAPDDDPAAVYGPHEKAAYLRFNTGPHAGRRVFLGDATVTLGRSDASVVVLSDAMVDLRHAMIVKSRRVYTIVPASSRTVVRVNSERVMQSRALANGDIFTIGASDVTFTEAGVDMEAVNAASTMATQSPFFAFSGQVRGQKTLTIGRNPDADLFLDHHRIEREHMRLVYRYPDFFVEDLSAEGTYLNGERVHDDQLKSGDEVRVGGYKIRFEIQPLRCSLDITPPTDDEDVPRFSPDVGAAASYQTLYNVPSRLGKSAAKAPSAVRKDRSTVLWVEPFDVKRTWRHTGMVAVAVLASLVVVLFLAGKGGKSFLWRPLGAGHRSAEFTRALDKKLGGVDECSACHGSFKGRVVTSCTQCHAQGEHRLREQHAADSTIARLGCPSCHGEHLTEQAAPLLIDGPRCGVAGCHATRHAGFFPQTAGPTTKTATTPRAVARRATFGIDLLADLEFDHGKRKTRIHQLHLKVGLEGQCGACHSTSGKERADGGAWQACFTCHGPRKATDAMGSEKCSECHREHGDDAVWATKPAEAGALSAEGTGQIAFLLLLLPALLVLAFHPVVLSRRRFLTHVAEEVEKKKKEEKAAEEMLCNGVAIAEATRLPRLIESKCVGSADCVAACPYQVLEMSPAKAGRPAHPVVARPELCHECGTCVAICGPGALVMMEPGKPFPLVDRPAVDANYEVSIPGSQGGVYVVGAVAAKPSVKNGINLGHWAVVHASAEGAHAGAAKQRGFQYEVIIIGGGPAGLSAALSARDVGMSYLVLEKSSSFADTVRSYPVGKPVQVNPPHPENPNHPREEEVQQVGLLWLERDASREEVLERWSRVVADVSIRYDEPVDALRAERGGFVVTTSRTSYEALKVIIAVGDRGRPRTLGVAGDDLPKVRYRLDDPGAYAGKHVMIAGGGNSAVEAAIALGSAGSCASVRIVYRKSAFERATPANRKAIDALTAARKIILHMPANIAEVRDGSVLLDGDGGEVANDVVFTLLGSDPPTAWLRKLGVEMTKKSADWEPGPTDKPAFLQLGERAP